MNQLVIRAKEKAIAHEKPHIRESITLKVDMLISDREAQMRPHRVSSAPATSPMSRQPASSS